MTDFTAHHPTDLRAAITAPRDIAALAVFRMAFGAIVVVSAVRFLAFGWAHDLFVTPKVHFRYWGFAWLPLPSASATYGLFVAMGVLGALVSLGLLYRPAVALLFAVFTYLQLVDVATYLNHYYLVSLLSALLFFIPAHRAHSLDAWLRPGIRAQSLPAWCTLLLRFQIMVVYVNAGLAKATGDWLLHAQPLSIWLSARTGLPIIGPYLDRPAVAFVAAWTGFLFDTTIVFFLIWRRSRPIAYLAVLGFHLMTHLLFPPIGMFPVIMVVSVLVFFDPAWPRRIADRTRRLLHRPVVVPATPSTAPAFPTSRWTWLGVIAAGIYLAVQIAMPLRGHLYGGNVLWHEQGMRFSWRVMARTKNGSVTFQVRDPRSGRTWTIYPKRYLTPVQEREMAAQPDLILQLAHHIARDFAARGYSNVEVRADAYASLNGRPAARLLDPDTDLARERDGLGPKPWITPAPAGPPAQLRPVRSS